MLEHRNSARWRWFITITFPHLYCQSWIPQWGTDLPKGAQAGTWQWLQRRPCPHQWMLPHRLWLWWAETVAVTKSTNGFWHGKGWIRAEDHPGTPNRSWRRGRRDNGWVTRLRCTAGGSQHRSSTAMVSVGQGLTLGWAEMGLLNPDGSSKGWAGAVGPHVLSEPWNLCSHLLVKRSMKAVQ